MPAEFHFLRPYWLLIIPVAIASLVLLLRARQSSGSWQRYIDPALQAYVLAQANTLRSRRWPVVVALAAASIAALALAGPAWERLPVPAFRSNEALVVALDLSRSMDASDVAPSRLARAKIKLLELLEQRTGGEMALVVFTTHAFTVTPLTADERTISSLVGSVSTSIMPSQGSFIPAGLEKAGSLLRQAGVNGGEILLITDAEADSDAYTVARDLASQGTSVHVLAVGTDEGAPIPEPEGGFVTDRTGQVVIPQLDIAGLQQLARAGGGRFARLTPDDTDLNALFPTGALASGISAEPDDEENTIEVWRDDGVWLSLLLLPLIALSFRRGWVFLLFMTFGIQPMRAEAFEWADLWKRRDQRAVAALERDDPAAAAELFDNPDWRGVAEYRNAAFADSAATLNGLDSIVSNYNRGNALARAGELQAAIDAYEQVLEVAPDHDDARYNRDLVQELLDQQQDQQPESDEQQQSQSNSGEGEQDEESSGNNESQEGAQGEEGSTDQNESNANAEPNDTRNQDSSDIASNQEESEQEQQSEMDAETGEPEEQALASERPIPEDIEEWASDQAAEQWLRRVPQDPGGLLRRKFLYQYQRMGVDQDGNYIWPADESQPW